MAAVLGALLLGVAAEGHVRGAWAEPPDAGPPPTVSREVWDQVQRDGAVRVLVELRLPSGAHAPEGRLAAGAVAAQRQAIAAAGAQVLTALGGATHKVRHRYESMPLLALEVGPAALRALEASGIGVARVLEDRINHPVLAESAPLVQADQVWAQGVDGAGTVIAVIDSGVDAAHPFLGDRVVEEACYSTTSGTQSRTLCPNGLDEQTGAGAATPCALPGCEHGTHVAGIAAGDGAAAGQPFSGVARGAGVMAIQVFSRFNRFADCGGLPPCLGAWDSDVLAALERVYARRGQLPIAAVNMSLGGGSFTGPCDGEPYKPIIDNLRAAGIATVVAAGNSGETGALTSPACISSAISVGATTDADQVAAFSNAAPFLSLFAPGDAITSSVPGGGYETFSGTSMAAPHVAGGWALLREARPGATVDEVLDALVATGLPVTDGRPGGSVTRPRIRLLEALVALSPGVLRILSVSPADGATGATLDVVIAGSGFPAGAAASFGPGVAVTAVTVTSATRLTARVSIAPAAALGPRDVQVSTPDGQSATKASAFRVMPPAPSLALAYAGKLRDRVGASGTAFTADGAADGTFRVTVVATQGYPRTITSLELRRSDGYGIYDTVATTSFWALGVSVGLDAALANGPGGAVSVVVADGQALYLFASDAAPTPFASGASFTLTARFADGTSATAVAVVPPPPAVTLAFLGRPRDRVGQSSSAFAGDGLIDGAFRATLQSTQGLPRTVVSLELRRADGYGVYDTVSSTSFWALGVASDLDGALLNGSGGAVSLPMSDGQGVHLFAADASPTPFAAGQTFTLTVRFADGAVSTASTTIVLPPAPRVTLAYLGRLRDRVGASSTAFAADGSPDGTFAVTVQANGLPRTAVELELRRSDGYGIYDTLPATSYWALGAARGLDAALLNGPGGAVSFAVADGETVHLFAADASPTAFAGGKTFALTARFADGTTATASAVIAPPLSLAYAGRLRDRVGQGSTAYTADGLADGAFVASVAASGAGRITQLELRRSDGYGIYDTVASTSFWALGVAASADGPLLNAPGTGAIDLAVAAGQALYLFAGDVAASPFAPGAVFTLTARYADGTTAVATAAVGP